MKLFFILIFISSLLSTTQCTSQPKLGEGAEQWQVNFRCRIYNQQGKSLWSFKAEHCLFLNDGRFIAGGRKGITMFGKDMTALWKKEFPVHHQMNWSQNRKSFLVLSDDLFAHKGKMIVADRLLEIDLHGRILKDYRYMDHLDEISHHSKYERLKWLAKYEEFEKPYPAAEYEFSHSNSIYEIPNNRYSSSASFLKAGNYIVNINDPFMTLIFDSTLSKVIWSIHHKEIDKDRGIHDVSVLPSGKFLFFYNRNEAKASTISTYDPVKKTVKNIYSGSPPSSFFSDIRGSAQMLPNGNLVFSDGTSQVQVIEIDPQFPSRILWTMKIPGSLPHQIYKIDLSSFLKNNRGL